MTLRLFASALLAFLAACGTTSSSQEAPSTSALQAAPRPAVRARPKPRPPAEAEPAPPAARIDEAPGEVGIASYYSDKLAGRLTASGVPYDPNEATCAHKKLPFGTRVVVTVLDSQQSITCVINDRGPFVDGRIIDLSKRLARELGLLERGLAEVRVVVVGDESSPPR